MIKKTYLATINSLFFLLFGLAMAGCEPQVYEVELPEETPKLAVHADWDVDNRQRLWLWLGRSVSILDNIVLDASVGANEGEVSYSGTDWIENAVVELYEDGLLFASFSADATTHTYRYSLPIGTTLRRGAQYELRVAAAGYVMVKAVQLAPEMPTASLYAYQPEAGRDIEGRLLDIIDLDIAAASTGYYALTGKIIARDSTLGSQAIFLSSPDANLESRLGRLIYKSEAASDYRLRLYCQPVDTMAYKLQVQLRRISVEDYQFYKSLGAYYASQNNPFAEPVVLYSNVENGLGLFSIWSRSVIQVID